MLMSVHEIIKRMDTRIPTGRQRNGVRDIYDVVAFSFPCRSSRGQRQLKMDVLEAFMTPKSDIPICISFFIGIVQSGHFNTSDGDLFIKRIVTQQAGLMPCSPGFPFLAPPLPYVYSPSRYPSRGEHV